MGEVTFFSLACVWPSVSSHVWVGSHFLAPVITVFYIQQCWEALVTVQPCSHVRRQLKGVYYVCLHVCVCVCEVRGRGCEGEPGALRIRQKDPWVGGQSSSSSLQTMESSSESNWALSDIGLCGEDCATKLSLHPPPSQLQLCSRRSSPSPVRVASSSSCYF